MVKGSKPRVIQIFLLHRLVQGKKSFGGNKNLVV